MTNSSGLTAAQEILLAAANLAERGKEEFSEWDLTVAAWTRSQNRFGCRGYEKMYPDHKRVMMEIMGQTKKDNPLRRGWMEKTKQNHYRITALGRAEAERLQENLGETTKIGRSAQPVYDAISPYIQHRVFRDYCKDREEPRTWLGAASFLGLTKNDRTHLEDRVRAINHAIETARQWMIDNQTDHLRRGVTGGGITIRQTDVDQLARFVEVLEDRFSVQIQAIRTS